MPSLVSSDLQFSGNIFPLPSGAQAGDIIHLAVAVDGGNGNVPSGWNDLGTQTGASRHCWRQLDGTEPSSWTLTATGGNVVGYAYLLWRDADYDTHSSLSAASGTTHNVPGLTVARDNSVLSAIAGSVLGAWSQPSVEWTELFDDSIAGSWRSIGAGATGTLTFTNTGSTNPAMISVLSLRPIVPERLSARSA